LLATTFFNTWNSEWRNTGVFYIVD